MALPKLETPIYETIIPSTGRPIEYRPFLVKEEKILMMAQESNDNAQAISALKKIIHSCTFGKVDPNELTTYDAEFLFLQLRIKSVGENVELLISDPDTKEEVKINVDLTQVEVSERDPSIESTIQLNESIGLTLKEITLKDAIGVSGKDMSDVTSLIATVIETIFDDEKVHNVKDVSKNELNAFIESLNHSQLEKITSFIQSQPAIQKEITYKLKDGEEKTITMRGLQDFFV
tara:strand:- start:1931 stop:2629 length:699 start_codon:yes stop_codon:yes gene_type:complete